MVPAGPEEEAVEDAGEGEVAAAQGVQEREVEVPEEEAGWAVELEAGAREGRRAGARAESAHALRAAPQPPINPASPASIRTARTAVPVW